MKIARTLPSALLLSLLAFACAQTSGGEGSNTSGDGDTSLPSTGGATTGTGGAVVVTTGGTPSTGGMMGVGGTPTTTGGSPPSSCMDGEMANCADEFPDFPLGMTNCMAGAWDVSTCRLCEADQPVACSTIDSTKPTGSVTCDSTGLGYVEDPSTTCTACVLDSTTDCEDPGNPTPNRAGEATCEADGYDWSECKFCESGDTLACDQVPGNTTLLYGDASCDETANMGVGDWDTSDCELCNKDGSTILDGGQIECVNVPSPDHPYTAGVADCNTDGDGYDQSACEWCGDNSINGIDEVCDGSAPFTPVTCVDIGLPVGDSGGADLVCDNSTCQWDVSDCGKCDPAFTGDKCIEDGSCSNSADCTDAQCAALQTCDSLAAITLPIAPGCLATRGPPVRLLASANRHADSNVRAGQPVQIPCFTQRRSMQRAMPVRRATSPALAQLRAA